MCLESGKILEVKAVDQVQATASTFHNRTFLFVHIVNSFVCVFFLFCFLIKWDISSILCHFL